MRPYKLKHVLSGLYYQPHKYRGSHLSKTGKIYQTAVNGLSSCISGNFKTFTIYCEYNSQIHKMTKDILNWSEPRNKTYYGELCGQIRVETNFTDWIKEEIQ